MLNQATYRTMALLVCVAVAGCLATDERGVNSPATTTQALRSDPTEPTRVPEPELDPREAAARAQAALPIEEQPSDVQARYYGVRITMLERAIALEDERLSELASLKADVAATDREQGIQRATKRRADLVRQHARASDALESIGGALPNDAATTR